MRRFGRCTIAIAITTLVLALALPAQQAAADHPDDFGEPPCGKSRWGDVVGPFNGEYWICAWDEDFGWIWEPAEGLWEVAWKMLVASDGQAKAAVTARTEEIDRRLKTGADVSSKIGNIPWLMPPSWLQTYDELWFDDGTGWEICWSSDWRSNTTSATSFTPTYNLGRACGDGTYGSWAGGYQWTGSDWNSAWVWSGILDFNPIPVQLSESSLSSSEVSDRLPPPPPSPDLQPRIPRKARIADVVIRADGTIEVVAGE